jgi:hypothetical protein
MHNVLLCFELHVPHLRNQNQIQSQIVNQKSNQQEGSTKRSRRSKGAQNQIQSQIVNQKSNQQEGSTKRSRRSKGASQWYGHPHDSVHDEISMAKACGEKHVTKKQQEQEKQTAAM